MPMLRSQLFASFLFACFIGAGECAGQSLSSVSQIGGSDHQLIADVCEDAQGDLYLSGSFRGLTDFDPGPGELPLSSAGLDQIFVGRYHADLSPVWVAPIGGAAWLDRGHAVAVGDSGEVVLVGNFYGAGDFDPGAGEAMLTPVDGSDFFCLKLDPMGAFEWVVQVGDSGEAARDVAIGPDEHIFIGGHFTDTLDMDPGPGELWLYPINGQGFFLELSPQGELLQALNYGAELIQVDPLPGGGYLLQGKVHSGMDADPGPGITVLDDADGQFFVVLLNEQLDLVEVRQFGHEVEGWGPRLHHVARDAEGNLILAGYFFGVIDADPGPGQTLLTAADGSPDAFVARLNPDGTLAWAYVFGSTSADQATGLTLMADGTILLSGQYFNAFDLDPGPGVWTTTVYGDEDFFLLALDMDGQFIGAQALGNTGEDWLFGTRQCLNGDIIGYGIFEQTIDFDTGPGVQELTSAGLWDIFITRSVWSGLGVEPRPEHVPSLLAYPSPATDRLYVRGLSDPSELVVYDPLGRSCQVPMISRSGDVLTLDLAALPTGNYTISRVTDGVRSTRSFIVAR